ncbi:MAG: uroporphyrinogen decarboxylase family protein, partial [Clostridiales bacterium]|nr:uroporphyrinogen decarboxylase family protein [Clostridiales bacterium]
TVDTLFPILLPDMVGFAEDMSYNHGPMLSHGLFNEFLLPYYRKVIPHIKQNGVKIMIDSDGDITSMIPWLINAGIEGAYPLERQSGVDVARIRREYPGFLIMGGYDKMVMSKGEADMREEFERLLPVMKSGGCIPSVDHQTPPGVSLKNYRIYIRLFEEYVRKAVECH